MSTDKAIQESIDYFKSRSEGELVKVGPEGYVHGWIKVSGPQPFDPEHMETTTAKNIKQGDIIADYRNYSGKKTVWHGNDHDNPDSKTFGVVSSIEQESPSYHIIHFEDGRTRRNSSATKYARLKS